MIFVDRADAGRRLAEKLARYAAEHPIVLGLTRGGVPVAAEVARSLGAELDAVVVRKIGAPGFPEYAVGAIAEGGETWLRREALRELGLGNDEVQALAEEQAAELARRVRLFRRDRPPPELAGRTVIVVDDGVATGATAHAAARSARRRGASRVILAAPVIAADSEPELRADFDEVVAVELPETFFAVGQFYARFEQVPDAEVLAALAARGPTAGAAGGGPAVEDHRERLRIRVRDVWGRASGLEADLVVPRGARGLVLFVHGSGSTRASPRNRFVASALQRTGLATLLFDLLTDDEAREDEATAELRFDLDLLTGRVLEATRAIRDLPRACGLRLGYFGSSTGAAAALAAAAELPGSVGAVVSRGGRADLVAPEVLEQVRAPTLLVIGGRDEVVLKLNRAVLGHLAAGELAVVPGAAHLFEEPGALDAVTRLAAGWFARHLDAGAEVAPAAPA